jgi:hypothetical protein
MKEVRANMVQNSGHFRVSEELRNLTLKGYEKKGTP